MLALSDEQSVLNPRTGEASIVSWTHGKAILSEVGSLSVEFMQALLGCV